MFDVVSESSIMETACDRAQCNLGGIKILDGKILELSTGKLNYYESKGTGPGVVFIHGNSSSGKSFQNQLTGAFGEKYRVVAIDLPGHGDSEPLSNASDYSFPAYARAVVEAVDALDMKGAVIAGWSLGGHAVLEASSQLDQAAGFVVFGTPPLNFPPAMEDAFLPNPAMAAAFNPTLSQEEQEGFVNAFFAKGSTVDRDVFLKDVANTDGNARAGMGASIAPGGYADEIEIVANLKQPLAVLHGAEEQLINSAYFKALTMPSLWRGEVQMIAGSGHTPQWETPDFFNKLMGDFIDSVAG